MEIFANIVALSSLVLYSVGIFSKKNSVMLASFAIGDFIYAMSYIILKNYLTASTFILGIVLSLILSYTDFKHKKNPIWLYVIFEISEVVSCVITYEMIFDILVLVANMVFVFFACYNNVKLLKFATIFFAALLLIYNIIITFYIGIIIELFILVITIIQVVKLIREENKAKLSATK